MLRAISLVTVAALFAVALGVPVDVPISFSTTASPLASMHNQSVLESVCRNMTPSHGDSAAQIGKAPYVVTVLQSTAAPGDTVQVRISGDNGEQFRGVYIQGRHGDTPVGQFLKPGPQSPAVRLSDCPPGIQNAASYISRQPISELTLDYVVPDDVPSIVFRATFVKTFSYYWTDVVSDSLLVSINKA